MLNVITFYDHKQRTQIDRARDGGYGRIYDVSKKLDHWENLEPSRIQTGNMTRLSLLKVSDGPKIGHYEF